jgi:hypothetical protein
MSAIAFTFDVSNIKNLVAAYRHRAESILTCHCHLVTGNYLSMSIIIIIFWHSNDHKKFARKDIPR